MSRRTPFRWTSEIHSQWAGNRRLRWGLLAIGGILWLQGLLLLGEVSVGLRQQGTSLREDIARLQPLVRGNVWPGRVDEARQRVAALRSMLWQESDIGVAEAAAQDWLRAVAAKARLGIRNLAISRPPAAATAATAAATASNTGSVHPIRVRLTTELSRLALTGFLAELARNEQVIVVERLTLHTASQPPAAEMELRLLVGLRGQAQ